MDSGFLKNILSTGDIDFLRQRTMTAMRNDASVCPKHFQV